MTTFIGKTYTTDNYIIKFVKAGKTCAEMGYKNEYSCGVGYGLEPQKDASGKDIVGSDGICYKCVKNVCENMSKDGTYYYTPAQKMNLKVQCGDNSSFVSVMVNGTRCLKCAKSLGGGCSSDGTNKAIISCMYDHTNGVTGYYKCYLDVPCCGFGGFTAYNNGRKKFSGGCGVTEVIVEGGLTGLSTCEFRGTGTSIVGTATAQSNRCDFSYKR